MSSVASPVTGAEIELRNAFAEFGDASVRLSGAFKSLELRVAHLSAELAESRRARERLGARLAATLEGLPGGVFLLDGAGRVVDRTPRPGNCWARITSARASMGCWRASGSRLRP